MSSTAYSTCLTPDPWLRITVISTGRVLIAIGLVLLLTLDIAVWLRAATCAVWAYLGATEIQRLERRFADLIAIRLSSAGEIAVLTRDEEWRPCDLQTGSIVLQKLAWLRLQTSNGEIFVELLRGNARQSVEWRRLQVIWRHIGASP